MTLIPPAAVVVMAAADDYRLTDAERAELAAFKQQMKGVS